MAAAPKRNRFVVTVQNLKTHRIDDVFGPFFSWDRANAFVKVLRIAAAYNDDNLYWVGIRIMRPQSEVQL